jgi:hypothetical protein
MIGFLGMCIILSRQPGHVTFDAIGLFHIVFRGKSLPVASETLAAVIARFVGCGWLGMRIVATSTPHLVSGIALARA